MAALYSTIQTAGNQKYPILFGLPTSHFRPGRTGQFISTVPGSPSTRNRTAIYTPTDALTRIFLHNGHLQRLPTGTGTPNSTYVSFSNVPPPWFLSFVNPLSRRFPFDSIPTPPLHNAGHLITLPLQRGHLAKGRALMDCSSSKPSRQYEHPSPVLLYR